MIRIPNRLHGEKTAFKSQLDLSINSGALSRSTCMIWDKFFFNILEPSFSPVKGRESYPLLGILEG